MDITGDACPFLRREPQIEIAGYLCMIERQLEKGALEVKAMIDLIDELAVLINHYVHGVQAFNIQPRFG
ncbi:hypothetical protein D3C72_2555090 [compost metagenome]